MRLRKYTVELTRTRVEKQTVTFVADMDATALDLDLVAEGYADPEGWQFHARHVVRGDVRSVVVGDS